MAACAANLGVLKHFVGDWFFTRSLDRFCGQLVAEFASAAILVELDVFEMAQVASSLGNLKFFLVGLVLVTGCTVYVLAFNLVLLFQVRLVNE